MLKIYLFFFGLVLFPLFLGNQLWSQQDDHWFYITAKSRNFSPKFTKTSSGNLIYKGNDTKLKNILSSYYIIDFKKTYRETPKNELDRTFFVRTKEPGLLQFLLKDVSYIFEKGKAIEGDAKKIFEPNDYGLTSTIGENIGLPVNLDYYDFLGLPKAWYYTTGNKDIFIGISDGALDSTDIEFRGKTKIFRKSSLANGHGISQAATAGAKGDNGYGFPGVCYNCGVYGTSYGNFQKLDQLVELSNAGARAINCSWIGRTYHESAQKVIDSMFAKGTIIVASGGNKDWKESNQGELIYYPASYDKVIAVSSGMYKYQNPLNNIKYSEGSNKPYVENIRGYVGRTAGFKDHKIENGIHLVYGQSVATLNEHIDILAPTVDIFSYGFYVLNNNTIHYNGFETTSGASPFVTGTIGLMFSLYPCLPVDEVESILKITSWNIDHIEANAPYRGMYGSGMLQTGNAVEMVYQLYNEKETVNIENQNFFRWDFKLTALSKQVVIQNQKFTDKASLHLTAKNKIILKPGTQLKPNTTGKIRLKIDSTLSKKCNLVLRDPSILDDY